MTCQNLPPIFALHYQKQPSQEFEQPRKDSFFYQITSDILRKWPLLLFPRSKKKRFWSALITLETPVNPVSSWPGKSVARSTVRSEEEDAGWLPWPGINPAPTSSESPTRCSCPSEGFCFPRERERESERIRPKEKQTESFYSFNMCVLIIPNLIWHHEKPTSFMDLSQYVPESSPSFIRGASSRNNNGASVPTNRCFWNLNRIKLISNLITNMKRTTFLNFKFRQQWQTYELKIFCRKNEYLPINNLKLYQSKKNIPKLRIQTTI